MLSSQRTTLIEPRTFATRCTSCGAAGDVSLPEAAGPGLLRCPECGAVLTIVNVEPWQGWINRVAAKVAFRHPCVGPLRLKVVRDELASELACCLVLAPWRLDLRMFELENAPLLYDDKLRCELTHLDRNVELKRSPADATQIACLRAPPQQGSPYYVVVRGRPWSYEICGWTDCTPAVTVVASSAVVQRFAPGTWADLKPIELLAEHMEAG